MALSNQQKSEKRRQELNVLAQEVGKQNDIQTRTGQPIETWRELETILKEMFLSGETISIKVKPTQGTLHPA